MKFEITFAPEALEDLSELRATDRSRVIDAIEVHLSYEPEKVSKSRIKRLRDLDHPQYRLRVDDIRVFYDVIYTVEAGSVEVLAIKSKADSIKWLADFGDN